MSLNFGFSLPALKPVGGAGSNPFGQLGPTLDLSFVDGATGVTDLNDPNGYTLNTNFITPQYQVAAQYTIWETNVGLVDKTFSQIVTFSRTSGATWFNAAGNLIGVDFSVTSNTIGTGSKTFTLDATAGVNRSWATGDSVLISDQSNSANNMTGTVTSYAASTQVLAVNVTSTGGSGTIASWRVSSLMPRFDYSPSTLAAQGLLIEEQRTNFFTNASGAASGTIGTGTVSGPDNVNCRTFIPMAGPVSFPNVTGPVQSFTLSLGQTVDWAWSGWFAAGPVGSFILEPRLIFSVSVNNATSFVYAELQIDTTNWTVRQKSLPAVLTEVSAPTITLFKPGLYRVTWVVRYTQDATGRNNISASIQARNTSNLGTYTADGVSGIQYALVQAETGSFVTSTIPTTTTALTRNADQASVNTLSPWYNAAGSTIYAEWVRNAPIAASDFPRGVDFINTSTTDKVSINHLNNQTSSTSQALYPSGFSWPFTSISGLNPTLGLKTAIAFQVGSARYAANGTLGGSDYALASIPTLDQVVLGSGKGFFSNSTLNGWLRRVTYYPRRLSNAELQAITA